MGRLSKSDNALIDDIPMELPANLGRYVDAPLTENEMELLQEGVNRQSPYGQADWRIIVSQELGLESTTRPQGRPKKDAANAKKQPVPFYKMKLIFSENWCTNAFFTGRVLSGPFCSGFLE